MDKTKRENGLFKMMVEQIRKKNAEYLSVVCFNFVFWLCIEYTPVPFIYTIHKSNHAHTTRSYILWHYDTL